MLELITQDFDLPVPLHEARLHLRVDHDDEDLMIDSYIRAASARLDGPDGYLGRCLTPKVWRLGLNQLRGTITLPLPPCQEVTSITYADRNGDVQTLANASYRVRGIGDVACITPIGSWPDTDSASITFTAGYTVVPDPIRAAILLRVAHMYEHRESVVIGESVAGLPLGEDDLLRNFRLWSF